MKHGWLIAMLVWLIIEKTMLGTVDGARAWYVLESENGERMMIKKTRQLNFVVGDKVELETKKWIPTMELVEPAGKLK